MIEHGDKIEDGSLRKAKVCIIGSGPAGITAAWYLQQAGIDVILLEAGRSKDDPEWSEKVEMYRGEAVGQFAENESDFLIRPYDGGMENPPWERERVLGGTSSHWGGWCRPLDPIDYEERPGRDKAPDFDQQPCESKFPGFPGWPIKPADLKEYYKKAADLCMLDGDDFSNAYLAGRLNRNVPPDVQDFDVLMYQVMSGEYTNFGTRTFPDDENKTIDEYANIRVILNANVYRIDTDKGHNKVSQLQVASLKKVDGELKKATDFTVEADVYVLACGTVENARQLLISKIGNEHELVGRYFMCHPLTKGHAVSIRGDSNYGVKFNLMDHQPDPHVPGMNVDGRFIPNAQVTKDKGIGRCWFWKGGGQFYFEMTPNHCSRVELSNEKDLLENQRTKIDWQLSEQDEHTYVTTTALFKEAMEKPGQGFEAKVSYTFDSWKELKKQFVVNGHHMGTTRMSAEPEDGVVDTNLKVHSMDNLYVAGGSVFPTAGISNPTFTIIALSIRLADHLQKKLKGSG